MTDEITPDQLTAGHEVTIEYYVTSTITPKVRSKSNKANVALPDMEALMAAPT